MKKTDLLSVAEKEMEQDPLLKRLVYQEELTMDVTEGILQCIEEKKLTRRELAKRLFFREDFLNEIISGQGNIPLRMISDIFLALGYKVHMKFVRDS
jgi:ribosome-binding protein aMBF1 (putative translation factor)